MPGISPTPTPSDHTAVRFDPSPLAEIDEADFQRYREAMPDRRSRIASGLHLSQYDAELLLEHPEWMLTHYRQWIGQDVAREPGAPVALPRPAAQPGVDPVPPPSRPTRRPGRPAATRRKGPKRAVGDLAA